MTITQKDSTNNWTTEQSAVWKTVELYTEQILKGKLKEFLDSFHTKYSGMNYFENGEINKSDIEIELEKLPNFKIIAYQLFPISIQIINDLAIVHYNYSAKYRNEDGKEKTKNGRFTDILIKEEESWLIVGDHVESNYNFKKNTNKNYKRLK